MMTTISSALIDARKGLHNNITDTPSLDARVLLSRALKQPTEWLFANSDYVLTEAQEQEFAAFINRRLKGEPVQYIVQSAEFMGLTFYVDKSVLIPRADTETLATCAIDIARTVENPEILDMCTGSGVIAVAIAHYVNGARLTAVDISSDACAVAKRNASSNGVAVNVMESDLFISLDKSQKYDIIVSNPPYIRSGDIAALGKNVKDYEPKLALDGGESGLHFYNIIADRARTHLKSGGHLLFEIGYDMGSDVTEILQNLGYTGIRTINDLSNKNRVILCMIS